MNDIFENMVCVFDVKEQYKDAVEDGSFRSTIVGEGKSLLSINITEHKETFFSNSVVNPAPFINSYCEIKLSLRRYAPDEFPLDGPHHGFSNNATWHTKIHEEDVDEDIMQMLFTIKEHPEEKQIYVEYGIKDIHNKEEKDNIFSWYSNLGQIWVTEEFATKYELEIIK